MRVVIDGFSMTIHGGTGIATYGRNLASALTHLGHEIGVLTGKDLRVPRQAVLDEVLLYDNEVRERRQGRLGRYADTLLGGTRQARQVQLLGNVIPPTTGANRLPRDAAVYNVPRLFRAARHRYELLRRPVTVRMDPTPDVVHWTIPLPIRVEGARNVYTIHDLIPLKLPYTTLDRKASYYALTKWVADTADLICTVSDTTREDVLAILGPDERKVVTTYQAVDVGEQAGVPDEEVAAYLAERYKLKHRGYFLFYGAIEPKKNVSRLLEAFMGGRFDDDLVVVSSSGWLHEPELALLRDLRVGGDVGGDVGAPAGGKDSGGAGPRRMAARKNLRHFQYASWNELVMLIRGARAVVFPSLYEGFGLPILEGMMCGTPVLTSGSGAMREIAGDAALLVDPVDANAIRAGMERLTSDAALWSRLRERGLRRAPMFSQEAYAERLGAAYARLPGA